MIFGFIGYSYCYEYILCKCVSLCEFEIYIMFDLKNIYKIIWLCVLI